MTIKHYEHLWEEAEMVASQYYEHHSEDNILENLKSSLSMLVTMGEDPELQEEINPLMGEVLFMMTLLSHRYGVDTYKALQEAIDNARVEILDPDLDNDDV